MVDVTGGTPPTNASPFAVPDDIKAVYDHFGDSEKYKVATPANLPAADNWVGRMLLAESTGDVYVCTALPGTWKIIASAETVGTVTAGLNGWAASGEMSLVRRHGIAYMSGSFTHATHTPGVSVLIGSIPAGFRPPQPIAFPVVIYASGQYGTVDIEPDGDIFLNNPGGVANVVAMRFLAVWRIAP